MPPPLCSSSPPTAPVRAVPCRRIDHLSLQYVSTRCRSTTIYENNDSSPAALAFFAEFDGSRQSTPATSPPPAPHDPPAEVVTDVIVTLVDGRSDALAILQATAARLSFNLLSTRQGPAVQLPDAPIVPTIASLDDLAASFAQWRDHARQCHRLLKLASSFRASRLSSSPPIVSTSTWEERDAALRAEAVSLPSSTPTTSEEQLRACRSPLLQTCQPISYPLRTTPSFATFSPRVQTLL